MRKGKLGKKLATVAMALAATVMMAAPASALAVTSPNKGCPANAANGYHNYVYKCTGILKSNEGYEHKVGWPWNRKNCTVSYSRYSCVELCDLCGLSLGNPGVTHPHTIYHSVCDDEESWCAGKNSYVTPLI